MAPDEIECTALEGEIANVRQQMNFGSGHDIRSDLLQASSCAPLRAKALFRGEDQRASRPFADSILIAKPEVESAVPAVAVATGAFRSAHNGSGRHVVMKLSARPAAAGTLDPRRQEPLNQRLLPSVQPRTDRVARCYPESVPLYQGRKPGKLLYHYFIPRIIADVDSVRQILS